MNSLKGVQVEVTHRGNMRRKYRIAALTLEPTRDLSFPVDERGTIKSLVLYFQETYALTIKYPNLPCLEVGNQQKSIYLPMEKMVNGGRVSYCTCINFARKVPKNVAGHFCSEPAQMCRTSEMSFALEPVIQTFSARPDKVESELKALYENVMSILPHQQKVLDLLIVILPENNGSLYGDLKRICETELGLISQCCLAKYVYKRSQHYLSNVALKINVKVGGRNIVLVNAISQCLPLIKSIPTIIFGADVTHPHPGENMTPSIAADWPEITKYIYWTSLCSTASSGADYRLIYNIEGNGHGGMIRELLKSFYSATRR